jgi:hypothetical protein
MTQTLIMDSVNPFQIPACLQQADLQQRRRQRFKKTVIAVMFGIMAMLVVLLIQGCVNEHAKVSSGPAPVLAPSDSPQMAELEPVLPANPGTVTRSAAAGPENHPVAARSEAVYVVKAGDTLSRLAKVYGTTSTAIKTANDLESDRIVIGAKLKIPQA